MDANLEEIKVEDCLSPIDERVRSTTERLEADFKQINTKIHRFPPSLGGIGSRYTTPSVVSLGPYHHGSPHLKQMEPVKHAAACYFCADSNSSIREVYEKIVSVAGDARGFYEEEAVAHFSDAEFAEMMFLDGCFLLEYIGGMKDHDPLLANSMVLSTGPCMLRDIMLLENQLPWLILETLMTFKPVEVYKFMIHVIRVDLLADGKVPAGEDVIKQFKAPHFLGLARLCVTGNKSDGQEGDHSRVTEQSRGTAASLSAIRLAEMGVKVKAASKTNLFIEMNVTSKGSICADLSLSPVCLNDFTTCWLVNMAAFETSIATGYPLDGFVISSYLSLLAMLMDKEEDVHELRARHIIRSFYSNKETLHFFKSIARHLRLGNRCFVISKIIDDYKREKKTWIKVHKPLYHHWGKIVTAISIVSVLVGIFKALLISPK
ncbi:hypothetical protein EJB05_32907, partial [Eragrostis curvula]